MEDIKQQVEELLRMYEKDASTKPENLEKLINESMQIFHKLVNEMNSEDPERMREAMQMAQELQKGLERIAKEVMGAAGIPEGTDLGDIANMLKPSEQKAMQNAREKLTKNFSQKLKKNDHGGASSGPGAAGGMRG